MRRIRIGNDFVYVWVIERMGEAEDLTVATSVKVTLSTPYDSKEIPFQIVDGNKIRVEFTPDILTPSTKKALLGKPTTYNLTLFYILPDFAVEDLDRVCTVDVDAFILVPKSAQADDVEEFTYTSDVGVGLKGDKGDSAFKVWQLIAGNEDKTEQDFFDFLQEPAVSATNAANAAAVLANTKAGLANDAAILANTKAGDADSAALAANTAAGNADSKATLANNAAVAASTEAGNANDAAIYANGAGDLAIQKAGIADSAANNANSKATEANNAAIAATNAAAIANAAKGWTPVTEYEVYGEKRVKKLTGYIGGTGAAPTANIGEYFTTGGFTANIALATDFRGAVGAQGSFSYQNPVLTVAGWTALSQTVTVTGVTASNHVIISPRSNIIEAGEYADCGVWCTGQGVNTLTFIALTKPTMDITLNIEIK